MGSQRLRDLMRFLRHEFGSTLPDDDYGRDVLREFLNQVALGGGDPVQLRRLGCELLPEIDDDDSLDDMVKEVGTGRKRKAVPLGRAIGLTYRARVALDIRTIDCCDVSPAQRRAIAAQKRAMDKRWEREKAGAKPHSRSDRKVRPWAALGISERTYYSRKKQAAKTVQSDPVAAFRAEYDVIITIGPITATQRAEPTAIPDHAADPGKPIPAAIAGLGTVADLTVKALYELSAPSTPLEVRTEIEKRIEAGELVTASDIKRLKDDFAEVTRCRAATANTDFDCCGFCSRTRTAKPRLARHIVTRSEKRTTSPTRSDLSKQAHGVPAILVVRGRALNAEAPAPGQRALSVRSIEPGATCGGQVRANARAGR